MRQPRHLPRGLDRGDPSRRALGDGPAGTPAFRDDIWELYDLTTDPSQAHDLAAEHPGTLAALRELFAIEAAKYQVFPLDDRVTERENPSIAGRLDLLGDRRSVTYHGRTRRLTEETTPTSRTAPTPWSPISRSRPPTRSRV